MWRALGALLSLFPPLLSNMWRALSALLSLFPPLWQPLYEVGGYVILNLVATPLGFLARIVELYQKQTINSAALMFALTLVGYSLYWRCALRIQQHKIKRDIAAHPGRQHFAVPIIPTPTVYDFWLEWFLYACLFYAADAERNFALAFLTIVVPPPAIFISFIVFVM